ncbi:MAG: tripartite tricarboxylate transporter substrate binding protein [Proteobacteria bacterium]|nr:tripartite tricarboxylate transporter substrate binding protein [Pseudomonadota bacterium]
MRCGSPVATVAVLGALLLLGGGAHAQNYPTRAITMMVAFPPGGFADITARPLAIPLGRELGQTVVVENRGGAGGAVGNAMVARAKPDGYTLLMALSSIAVIPEAERMAKRPVPYEMTQFVPIALIAAEPNVVLVRPEAPWKTFPELIADAKRRPGQISYSSSGLNGVIHLGVEIFAYAAQVKFLHAPYQGGGPSMNAILVGEVDFTSQSPSVGLPHAQAGKVRALASTGTERAHSFPDVPTLRELGYNAEYVFWAGMFAPVDTPPAIIETIRAAVRKSVDDDGFKRAMTTMGTPVRYLEGAKFSAFVADETRRLAEVVKRIGKLE